MQEKLLQFIWKYNLYRPTGLTTTDGEPVSILHGGTINTNAGPDFSEARIKIADTMLVGNIELHVRTSDWLRHRHQHNPAFSNVILHVVYEHDMKEWPGNIPVLALEPYIPEFVLHQYNGLLRTSDQLPCAGQLHHVKDITKESWLNRLLVERWEQKLESWQEELSQTGNDWSTLLYRRMAANFGFKINTTPFLLLAQSLPIQVLGRQQSLLQIETLIFGQAGMLQKDFKDEYPKALQKEYQFLQHKFGLTPVPEHLWKFMRLRPANFPTVRLAQFAAFVHQSQHLFTTLGTVSDKKETEALLSVTASEYWDNHYRFDEPQKMGFAKKLGMDSIHNIMINTVAPIRFLYAYTQGTAESQEQALSLLESLPPETNHILGLWKDQQWPARNAAQSQALLQLYNQYCTSRRCLECSVGLSIIRSGPDK